tara:strand:- start:420 stop:1787 length:1368 start_codon:yes stop_codon:yes gene_type:complete
MLKKDIKFNPLITIYITNYNYGRFLRDSIQSVFNQTYANYELIIIDDGSTDDSRNILNKYKNYKNLKIIFQKNKGLNYSNNIALKLSRGDYITRLDADDWLDENFLQVMVDQIKKDPKIGMIFCNYFLVNNKGVIQGQFLRHDFKKVRLLDQPAHGACSLINTNCLKLMGGYNEKFKSQDGVDLWIRLIQKYKVKNINLPLFYYRQHGNNLTTNTRKLFRSRDKIFETNVKGKEKIKNTICIIPIRGDNENSIALKKIKSKTVLSRLIKELFLTKKIKKIIVTTPDKAIIDYIKKNYKNKITIIKRENDLAGYNVPIYKTLVSIVNKIKNKLKIDSILKINVDHPLLNSQNFESAINIMNIFNTDEVLAVKKENDNFFYHNGKGLKSFKKSSNLTLEREEVYRQIGSLHLYTKKCLFNYKRNRKIGHLILDDVSAHRAKTKKDLKVSELLLNNSS